MSTLYSSFNASISGLNSNATRLSAISDNIANTGTSGYKRVITSFHSLVIGSSNYGPYIAGGVRASTMRLIDEQGALTTSSNPTDLAVSGRGFLPVTNINAAQSGTSPLPLMLATTGSFRPDAQGYLRTPAGHVLLAWPADPDGNIPPQPRDSIGGLQPLRLVNNQLVSQPTENLTMRVNLPSRESVAGANGTPISMSLEYYSTLGGTEALDVAFTPTVPATGASNEWTMRITDPNAGGALVGEYVVTFSGTPPTGGRIQSVSSAPGNPGGAYDPATGAFTVTADGRMMAINIGRPGDMEGMSQMEAPFSPIRIDRDGAPVQNLLGVQVDPDGKVRAFYDSGLVRTIAQIPLVDVPNPNGLESLDNQAYRVSADSGAMFMWDAGEGPTGSVMGFMREESATDVAAELTNMIQTQRAYSSNAKVIQTVDEMLQETTNIKR